MSAKNDSVVDDPAKDAKIGGSQKHRCSLAGSKKSLEFSNYGP